jgi:hypothetical protein
MPGPPADWESYQKLQELQVKVDKLELTIEALDNSIKDMNALLGTQNDLHSIFNRVYALEQWRVVVDLKLLEQREELSNWKKAGFALSGSIIGFLLNFIATHFVR